MLKRATTASAQSGLYYDYKTFYYHRKLLVFHHFPDVFTPGALPGTRKRSKYVEQKSDVFV